MNRLWQVKMGEANVNTTKLSVKVGPDMALKKKNQNQNPKKPIPKTKQPTKKKENQQKKLHCPFAIFSSLKK